MNKILLILFLYSIPAISQNSQYSSDVKNYLPKNNYEINITDTNDLSSFSILDSTLSKNSVFFIGEKHFEDSDVKIQIKLFKYLYYKANVRLLIAEWPISHIYLFNKKLSNPDDKEIKADFERSNMAQNRLFIELEKFYHSLDEHNKFIIKGVDCEHPLYGMQNLIDLLYKLTPSPKLNYFPPFAIEETFNLLEKACFCIIVSYKKSLRFAEYAYKDMQKHEKLYEIYLGKNYNLFRKIVEGILVGDKFDSYRKNILPEELNNRELFMYKRFCEILKEYPDKKSFGVFGHVHIAKEQQSEWFGFKNWTSLAALLNTDSISTVKNKIFSIITLYEADIEDTANISNSIFTQDIRRSFFNMSKKPFVLFDLCTADSPQIFKETCNTFDYLIINQYEQLKKNRGKKK